MSTFTFWLKPLKVMFFVKKARFEPDSGMPALRVLWMDWASR